MQTSPGYPHPLDGTISLRTELERAAGELSFLTATPYLDAKLLLMKASDFTEIDLVLRAEEVLDAAVSKNFRALVERRKKGEPLAYITGVKGFMGEDFEVGRGVLIPRPETELLVEHLSLRLRERGKTGPGLKGLEVGLGSGIISLSLLKRLSGLKMVATDISEEALMIASKNAERLGLSENLKSYKINIYDESLGGDFDFLVSNPPYIAEEEYEKLDGGILDYEPKEALLADEEGYYFYRKITALAPKLVKKGGFLAFEIGYNQAEGVIKLMEEAGFIKIDRIKDYSQFDRVLIGEQA